jgi:1,4-alpha-glucan branching enzyme
MSCPDFVLMLHSHLPWVLHHGRWPHGSDWLCEAALDTYLPLVEQLRQLDADRIPAPLTIGITPVLANQLAHPDFPVEFEHFLEERLRAARRAPTDLASTGDDHLIPLAAWWRDRLERLGRLLDALDGNLVVEFRRHEEAGRIEIASSAATHGYLPLLGRDESIRLQLLVGAREHQRLFGRPPRGCWVPECAYRPRGPWAPPGAVPVPDRAGVDEHLAEAGYDYFFADSHLAAAGHPLGTYADVPLGAERFDAERHDVAGDDGSTPQRSPYRAYVVTRPDDAPVQVLVRDPVSSMQVWSRHQGYPGDAAYLEFHKIRWPGGLKLWRVTGPDTDLGAKQPYDVAAAAERLRTHAGHFAWLLGDVAKTRSRGSVIVAPFDTELFGHWWFEGVDFLGALYRALAGQRGVQPVTASGHVGRRLRQQRIRLTEGSWGARGDHSMWLNPGTRWTWERLWPLENRFWTAAPFGVATAWARPVAAAAARQLLLAQSSDWQFIISTGAAADYAEQRFGLHCGDAESLLEALTPDAGADRRAAAAALAERVDHRDAVFPDILGAVDTVLARP